MLKLYVDDVREAPEGWVRTGSITFAIKWLSQGYVDEISLDFDCGLIDESYIAIAYYIASMEKDKRPIVHIHTDNPEGRKRMEEILNGK